MARRTEKIGWTASASRAISGSLNAMLIILGLIGGVLMVSPAVPSADAAETEPTSLSQPPGFELAGSNGYGVEVSGSRHRVDRPPKSWKRSGRSWEGPTSRSQEN